MRDFNELLAEQWEQQKFLCIGLDSDLGKIPESARPPGGGTRETLVAFNRHIVDATKDIAASYKPNMAFYESHGDEGFEALRETIQYVHNKAPDAVVILDAKRGDIGNTNEQYAASAFDHLRADALTVNPYPGKAALEPFLKRADKGIIVWCRTSNEGAGEFQDLQVSSAPAPHGTSEPLYMRVARNVASEWNGSGNCALVVGATYPDELRAIRELAGDMPILIPGIGAQSGDLGKAVRAGRSARGGMLINASRAIIFASREDDFADAARAKARELDAAIRDAFSS